MQNNNGGTAVTQENTGRTVLIWPENRVDSGNSKRLDAMIEEAETDMPEQELIVDFGQVEYISSAGLRVLLSAVKRRSRPVTVREVSPEVYDIMEMTGISTMLNVERRMRRISIDGCEIIGAGGIGTVYRIDPDTIVKVFKKSYPLERVREEQRLAKLAFMKGVPTAIPFDVVRVGDCYGSVFELVDARTLNDLLIEQPDHTDDIIRQYADLVRTVRNIRAEPGELPSCREKYLGRLDIIGDLLSDPLKERLRELLEAIPESLNLVHGDFHMKNILLSKGEPVLIDMDMLGTGDAVFEYAGIYVTYKAFTEHEPDNSMKFYGIPAELCDRVWNGITKLCIDAPDRQSAEKEMDRIVLAGNIRFLQLLITLGRADDEIGRLRVNTAVERLNAVAWKTERL